MSSDLEKRVPGEILEELIEEGTEAFRGILEKLFNVAMQLESSEFLGAEAYERTKSRRGYRNGFKGKRIRTRVGELRMVVATGVGAVIGPLRSVVIGWHRVIDPGWDERRV